MTALYQDDLAYIHDAGFGQLAEAAADHVRGLLERDGVTAGTVVDLGCAGGRLLGKLGSAGFTAHGIEHSSAFLSLARTRLSDATLVESSVFTAALPACVAVTAIGEVLCYSDAPAGHARSLRGLFTRINAALPDNGLFVFDVITDASAPAFPKQSWQTGADWAVLSEIIVDDVERAIRRHIVAFREVDGCYRRTAESHLQVLLAPSAVRAMLASCGFASETFEAYGDTALAPRRLGFLARKTGAPEA